MRHLNSVWIKYCVVFVIVMFIGIVIFGSIYSWMVDEQNAKSLANSLIGKTITLEGAAHPARFTIKSVIQVNTLITRLVAVRGVLEVSIPEGSIFIGSSKNGFEITVNMQGNPGGESWVFPTSYQSPDLPGLRVDIYPTDIKAISQQ